MESGCQMSIPKTHQQSSIFPISQQEIAQQIMFNNYKLQQQMEKNFWLNPLYQWQVCIIFLF